MAEVMVEPTAAAAAELLVQQHSDGSNSSNMNLTPAPCIDLNKFTNELLDPDLTQNPLVQLVFGLLYIAIFVCGVVLNTGVIWNGLKFVRSLKQQLRDSDADHRRLKTELPSNEGERAERHQMLVRSRGSDRKSYHNLLLINLIVADLMLCFVSLPTTPVSTMMKEWVFPHVLCKLVPYVQAVAVMVTSWTLAIIAVDRFVHIRSIFVPPISFRMALFLIGLTWLLCGLVSVPILIAARIVPAGNFCGDMCTEEWPDEWTQRAVGLVYFGLSFGLPLLIISICYLGILLIVRVNFITGSRFGGCMSLDQRRAQLKKKKRSNLILVGMVVSFAAAWMPLSLYNVLTDLGFDMAVMSHQLYLGILVRHAIAMTTVVWNPLLSFWLASRPNIGGGAGMRTSIRRSSGGEPKEQQKEYRSALLRMRSANPTSSTLTTTVVNRHPLGPKTSVF